MQVLNFIFSGEDLKTSKQTKNRVRDVVYWEFGWVFLFGTNGRVQYKDNAMVMKINFEGA